MTITAHQSFHCDPNFYIRGPYRFEFYFAVECNLSKKIVKEKTDLPKTFTWVEVRRSLFFTNFRIYIQWTIISILQTVIIEILIPIDWKPGVFSQHLCWSVITVIEKPNVFSQKYVFVLINGITTYMSCKHVGLRFSPICIMCMIC